MTKPYVRKDHLYRKAKEEGYRSRAAYKLIELDQKYKLIRPTMKVLDLGCYPGGWLQVVLERVGPKGRVVGIDLKEVDAVEAKENRAIILKGDVFDRKMRDDMIRLAEGRFDLILSDLSPQLSGIHFGDAARSAELVECALDLSVEMLEKEGNLVTKIFPGAECEEVARRFRKTFASFSRHSLKSSRKSSNELYFVARGFLGVPPA